MMPAEGELRLDPRAPAPWRYRGSIRLPAGRQCTIEAQVEEGAGGKFFLLRVGLVPGLTAAELEATLTECEGIAAERVRRERAGVADLPADELPF